MEILLTIAAGFVICGIVMAGYFYHATKHAEDDPEEREEGELGGRGTADAADQSAGPSSAY